MKIKYTYWLLPLVVYLSFLSCKKKPSQPTGSNSTYNNAQLYIDKQRYIYRKGTGQDSTSNALFVDAKFGDSSDLVVFHEPVGNVSINGLVLYGNSPYEYNNSYVTDSEMAHYNTAHWKVISPNGIIDLDYDGGSMAYYQDTVPYTITRSSGFSIKVNPVLAPNADSVTVEIGAVSKTVSINADSLYFSPSELAVLLPVNDWSAYVRVYCFRQNTTTINGRGYNISSYRQVFYNVNIN